MGSLYKWNCNPLQDFLLKSIIYNRNISAAELQSEAYAAFTYFLQNVLENQNDAVYLDFKIIDKNNYFKVVGENAISAIWLSGIFPQNSESILKNNMFIIGSRKYTYNKKKKILTYTEIKNG